MSEVHRTFDSTENFLADLGVTGTDYAIYTSPELHTQINGIVEAFVRYAGGRLEIWSVLSS